jgi:NTE family protein
VSNERLICVLSGGGAKAAAQVGALRALEDRGLVPHHYVGTSMGSVVAACFASGLSYAEVLKRITSVSRRDVAALNPGALFGLFAESLLRDEPLRETIASLVPARRFEDLTTPLTVTAVDADNGQLVLFGAGGRSRVPLLDALYASCALPLYYPPGAVGDRRFLDGGLRAVLPLDVAATFDPELVYAVMVGPSLFDAPQENGTRMPAWVRVHNTAMRILMAAQTEALIAKWKQGSVPFVLVQPRLGQEATFAVDSSVHYVEEGYRAASRALNAWEAGG